MKWRKSTIGEIGREARHGCGSNHEAVSSIGHSDAVSFALLSGVGRIAVIAISPHAAT